MDDLAQDIAEIVERQAQQNFPEVLPTQVESQDVPSLEQLLTSCMQLEHAKVQSYMDARYQEYRESLPLVPESESGV